MSELICITGRISTTIGDKQQSKVADLGKYVHPHNSQGLYCSADSTMAKAPYLGVVSFGRFVPDSGSGSVTMLTAMVNLP